MAAEGGDASPAPPTQNASQPSMLKGASLLISLQLLSRLVTFAANQILLRYLTAPLLGLSAQLEVYYLSVLFFARESLRVAIQRQGAIEAGTSSNSGGSKLENQHRKEGQIVVNLGYLAVILGVAVSIGLGWMYLSYADNSSLQTPYFTASCYLYGVAAVIELLSEPCFVLMQIRLQFGTRATAESLATLFRCLVVFGSAIWASQRNIKLGVLPFALGQVTFGVTLSGVYLFSGFRLAASGGFSVFPKAVGSSTNSPGGTSLYFFSLFYKPTMALARSMMAQSVVKHLLTQGDTFLVSILSSTQVQGAYALANNYGGLLARLLFQPVEESSRSYFSRLLSTSEDKFEKTKSRPSQELVAAKKNLHLLIRSYLILSALIIGIGPFAAPPLLAVVAGRQWTGSGAGYVLSAYCFYIPCLALNGITESFVASVATEKQVNAQSLWMAVFSFIFASSAYTFMRVFPLGAVGLVAANAINMLCRIVWSALFIRSYFSIRGVDFEIASLIPSGTIGTSVAVLAAMHQMNTLHEYEINPLNALLRVAVVAAPAALLILFVERKFILECVSSLQLRRKTQ